MSDEDKQQNAVKETDPLHQDDEYPAEEQASQHHTEDFDNDAGQGNDVADDAPLGSDDGAVSETPSERFERRKREANTVWFSGFFSGETYVAKPKRVKQSDLDESEQEELMGEESYEIPRGYKYLTENLPPILQAKPQGKLQTALIVHAALTFVAFVFLLVSSCPIAWYRGKNKIVRGLNYHKVKYTLYRQTGGNQTHVSLRELRTCPIEKQFYQSIAASVIMATVFSLISLLMCIVRLVGRRVGYGWIIIFNFFAFIWALTGNAMSISQFHLSRCGKPRFPEVARLDAGFALSLVAWVFLMAALIIVILATKMNFGPAMRSVRVMDTWFLLFMLSALLLTVVGNVMTIWKRHFGTSTIRVVRVTYWHVEVILGDGTNLIYGRAAYRCPAYNRRIKASISFLILGSIAIGLAIFLGVGSFVNRKCRLGACIAAIVSWVFLIISWVTSVAIFHRKLCQRSTNGTRYDGYPGLPSGVKRGYLKFKGYGLAEGVVLPIIAWIFVTAAIILNIVVPWPSIEKGK